MIESIKFENFKVLRDTTLPLTRLTLLVGPNGSGKSTVFQALLWLGRGISSHDFQPLATASVRASSGEAKVSVTVSWAENLHGCQTSKHIGRGGDRAERKSVDVCTGDEPSAEQSRKINNLCSGVRVYALNAAAIAKAVQLAPEMRMGADGEGLAGVLDRLRDEHPERFEALNRELGRWLPEFDRVLFETPSTGYRAIQLRTRAGGHAIGAADISQGTLLALAILTLAYLPDPPPIVCLEEPGRGIHPRLLRDVRDAMYRLAYPDSAGEGRSPVQVIATTHLPHMLDLFRDHPEEIVIAEKLEDNVRFEKLSDRKDLEHILRDTHLGDAWYSGVLGGVPTER